MQLKEPFVRLIKAEAENLGFSFISIAPASQPPHYPIFMDWLSRGYSGEMHYLGRAQTILSRGNPAGLLNDAKSIIVFGLHYPPLTNNLQKNDLQDRPTGWIASYATYQDYHSLLKQKARSLMDQIIDKSEKKVNYRIFVDSAPLMEKDTAYMAGTGWIGKHSLLISPVYGSYLMLGCILTNLDLPASLPFTKDLCGNCRRCIQSCPTGCITDQHTIDANKCIAYLTIEYKGIIPRDLRPKIGQWIFGCDICQNNCPINRKIDKDAQAKSEFKKMIHSPVVDLIAEIQLEPEDFQAKFKGTAVLRLKPETYKRNLIIAMGNSKSPACAAPLKKILTGDPIWELRLQAAWALGQIHTRQTFQIIEGAIPQEQDERVKAEMLLTLKEYQ